MDRPGASTHPNLNRLFISNLHQHCSVFRKVIGILNHVTSFYVNCSTQPAIVFVKLRVTMGQTMLLCLFDDIH